MSLLVPQIYFLLSVRRGVASAVLELQFHGTMFSLSGFANKTRVHVVKAHRGALGHCSQRLTSDSVFSLPDKLFTTFFLLNSQTSLQDLG